MVQTTVYYETRLRPLPALPYPYIRPEIGPGLDPGHEFGNPMALNTSLVWFRRDLRAFDHAALRHALQRSARVHSAFIFDKTILDALPRADRRVEFIHACVAELAAELQQLGGHLIVRHAVAERETCRNWRSWTARRSTRRGWCRACCWRIRACGSGIIIPSRW